LEYVAYDLQGKPTKIEIRLLDAYLKYYLHIRNPEKLSNKEWAEEVQNLHFIRTKEKENSQIPQ